MSYIDRFRGWVLATKSQYIYVGLLIGSALVRLACITVCAGVTFLLTFSAIHAGLNAANAGWPWVDVVQLGTCVLASLIACALMGNTCPRAVKRARWRLSEGLSILGEGRGNTATEKAHAKWQGHMFDHHIGLVTEILYEAIRNLYAPNMELSFAGLLTQMTKISRELEPLDERLIEVLVDYLSYLVDDPAGEFVIHAIAHGILSPNLLESIVADKQQKIWAQMVKAQDRRTQG